MDISELRKLPHLSASSINDYVECGLLFKFGRIDKVPWESKSDALEFGTSIHKVLGEFYQHKLIGNSLSIPVPVIFFPSPGPIRVFPLIFRRQSETIK